jgi:hypothetical protein
VSKQTYFKCIAIAILRRRMPDGFQRFARLGPDKLFGIALLNSDVALGMSLERLVDTKRGPVKLRYLTDDELCDYWRSLAPVKRRDPLRAVERELTALDRRLVRACADRRPPRPTLAMLLAKTRVLTARVEALLSGAA